MPQARGTDKPPSPALPRRAAARKASRLAAEQLESSPIPSDGDEPSFGEPSTPRSAVRVTYGGKRKYRHSPIKSSPSAHVGQAGARPRSRSLIEQSPGRQRNGGPGASGRGRSSSRGRGAGGGGRKAQTKGKKPFSMISSGEESSESLSDLESVHAEQDEREVAKPSSSRPAAVTTPKKPVAKSAGTNGHGHAPAEEKGSKKRPLSVSSSSDEGGGRGGGGGGGDDSLSPLSPLSSPEVHTNKSPAVQRPTSILPPRIARQFMRSQSQAEAVVGSSKKTSALKQSKSFDQLFVLDSSSSEDDAFDEFDVGSLVWVSIDPEGNLRDVDEEDAETLWWPAKVTFPRPCMRVSLFGTPPGHNQSSSAKGQPELDVPNPSPSNVRSIAQNGRMRFDEANYRPGGRQRDSVHASPRKKRKLDLDAAWGEARELMLRADEAQGGELARTSGLGTAGKSGKKCGRRKLDAFPSLEGQARKGKGKGKARNKGDDSGSDDPSDSDAGLDVFEPSSTWRAPSVNPLLDIPGELVLAKEGKARTQYWPAKLLDYVKPTRPSQRPKYKVLFFDGTILQIEPDWFWTTADDEFATCKLGESTGNYGLDNDVDSMDEDDGAEDFNRPFAPEDEATLRAPSPLPSLPPPPPEEFEYDLSIAEQFDYVKPVLAAVLEGEYAPARERHEGFMRGAGARRKVLDSVPVRGSLSAKEKEEVAYLVRSWARRRERRREMGLSVEYPLEKLYPPDGDAAPGEAGRGKAGESNGHVDDDTDSVLTPASDVSGGDTEPLAPFDAEPPPSSFAPTEGDTDDDERARDAMPDAPACDETRPDSTDDAMLASPAGTGPTAYGHARPRDGETAAIVATASEEPAGNETLPRAAPRTTFHDLDAVEKITYCNNVLLQEAILQLLLWRTGQRKALGLLSPDEEQRLHDIALEEGEKTNWVHDIIRMRQAMEKTMLPSTAKGKSKAPEAAPGGRARTRRAV
ncbi:hypothetical protein OH77DRAFT_1515775 [Trametes cingulata]|nr:hypothetical protein OH77DRAFT_1515775 [Trametes cingulata]